VEDRSDHAVIVPIVEEPAQLQETDVSETNSLSPLQANRRDRIAKRAEKSGLVTGQLCLR
jgi:hypothetical protein